MKRTETFILIFISMFILLSAQSVSAQERTVVPEGYVLVDSVVYRPAHAVDTTLAGQDIFRVVKAVTVPGKADVVVNQTPAVEASMRRQVQSNKERTMSGYRVRIFFDNKQTARAQSEEIEKNFAEQFPQCPVYRTYTNPYFKVAVGDFRTKSDAVKVLETVKRVYPKAFIIKDIIKYPQ